MRKITAALSMVSFAILAALMWAVAPVHAAADASAVATVDAGALTLRDTLVSIATTVLPYAVAIIAILVGWRLARRFFRTS